MKPALRRNAHVAALSTGAARCALKNMTIEITAHDWGTADLAVRGVLRAARESRGSGSIAAMGRKGRHYFRALRVQPGPNTLAAFQRANLPLGARVIVRA